MMFEKVGTQKAQQNVRGQVDVGLLLLVVNPQTKANTTLCANQPIKLLTLQAP